MNAAVAGDARRAALALLVLVATAALVFGCGPYQEAAAHAPDQTLLDERPRHDALAFVQQLGPVGRDRYAAAVAFDCAFACVHGVALFVLLRIPLRRRPPLATVAWLAPAAALLDLGENGCIGLLLREPPVDASRVLWWLTTVKLALLPVLLLLLAGAWLLVLARRGSAPGGPFRG